MLHCLFLAWDQSANLFPSFDRIPLLALVALEEFFPVYRRRWTKPRFVDLCCGATPVYCRTEKKECSPLLSSARHKIRLLSLGAFWSLHWVALCQIEKVLVSLFVLLETQYNTTFVQLLQAFVQQKEKRFDDHRAFNLILLCALTVSLRLVRSVDEQAFRLRSKAATLPRSPRKLHRTPSRTIPLPKPRHNAYNIQTPTSPCKDAEREETTPPSLISSFFLFGPALLHIPSLQLLHPGRSRTR